ncbi:MAG TPA: hypothetical protein VMG62_07250 [Solirubrobacteraceae bacterium]|nr:hypothetical protein [Solirubrobacteraceae bacterium]
MTDFLDEKRQEITDRLQELAPLVEEFRRLEAAASALDGIGGAVAPRRRGPGRPPGSGRKKAAATTTRKKPGRPKKVGRPKGSGKATATATATTTKRPRAGRRKGSGTRGAQALSLVQGQPGITIPELAAKMGIKQNYLYRVLPGLEQEGKIAKQGRGWHPKA